VTRWSVTRMVLTAALVGGTIVTLGLAVGASRHLLEGLALADGWLVGWYGMQEVGVEIKR
jgi:hypothetical protein